MQPVSNSFKVVTWNLGNDNDFARLQREEAAPLSTDLQETEVEGFRNSITKGVLNGLDASIICLQEAGTMNDAADMNQLVSYRMNELFKNTNYEFFSGEQRDTCIAWDSNRFECKAQYFPNDPKRNEYSIVDLQEKSTGKMIRVVSAHLTSMNLVDMEGDETGNKQLQQIMEHVEVLNRDRPVDGVVLGMDANAPTQVTARMEIPGRNGYVLDDGKNPTNFNYKYKVVLKADYVGVKSLGSELTHKTFDVDLPLKDTRLNPSDHLPVLVEVKLADKVVSQSKGIFSRLFGSRS